MLISEVELREIGMRLLHPFETSFGVTLDRRIIIIRVREENMYGFGEVTAGEGPFYSHETTDTAWSILSDFVVGLLLGRRLTGPQEFGDLVAPIRGHNMAKGGLEAALWDLEARRQQKPLWQLIGGTRQEIECGVSIGIQGNLGSLLEKIQKELDSGYRRIKIKIKPGWDVDVVSEIRRTFPDVPLMCDANSAYTLADTEVFQRLDDFNIMMFEQPLHYNDIVDHATLQKSIRTPICLDESIHSAEDARKAIDIGACRIINIKLGRVGGYREAQAVHDVCRDRGIPVWCGGMLESGIGRAHNIALSSLENFCLPGDVAASRRYWAEDVIQPDVEVSPEGTIRQRTEPGIGYSIREELLSRLTVRTRVFAA